MGNVPAPEVGLESSILVRHPPPLVWRALSELRVLDVPLARVLGPFGWVTLVEEPPRRLTLGLVGQLWRLDLGLRKLADAAAFLAFSEPDHAKVVFSCALEDLPGGTLVTAETRVSTTDAEAASKLQRYGWLVGLGARLTVSSGLAGLRRRADLLAGQPA